MKRALLIILVQYLAFGLMAQPAQIKEFEKSLSGKQGETFVADAFTLAGMYYAENLMDETADWAEKAYNAARKLGMKEEQATALNLKGKALVKTQSKRSKLKEKAYKAFEESNALTENIALKKENLEHLRVLANLLKKDKEVGAIDRDMALLAGEEIKEELKKEIKTLADRQEELQTNHQVLRKNQQSLESLVAKKDAAIQNMTHEQIRRELLLATKERLLDSLTFASILDSLDLAQADMLVKQQDAELREQKAELELRKSQRNLFIAVAGLVLLLAVGLFLRYYAIKRYNKELAEKNRIIEAERKRSEELLLNILPVTVADELKLTGAAATRHYDEATVLFTDFKGFSEISKILPPADLVTALDYAFKNFDRIIGHHGLEKIKTIGDAYMCAGGLPGKDKTHPINVVKAALDIQHFLREWNAQRAAQGLPAFEARIGIHTGPLVAGVVGSKKFAYDIWGDTVNVAARMETSSEAGRVNISASTFQYVKDVFNCEYRGKVPAKNVGEVEMYYVD